MQIRILPGSLGDEAFEKKFSKAFFIGNKGDLIKWVLLLNLKSAGDFLIDDSCGFKAQYKKQNVGILKNYSSTGKGFWTGRVDDLEDRDSYRIYQIVRLLNLQDVKSGELDYSKLNICLLEFRCDEGTRRNKGRAGAEKGPKYSR